MTPEEYKETMKDLAQDENLLPGIYNFCDQWCQKCTWTDRCFTHRMSALADRPMEEKRIDDPEFWDEISNSFKATGMLLHDQAEELGIDLDDLKDEEMEIDEEEPYFTGNWPDFVKVADDYGFAVLKWLEKNNITLRENCQIQMSISEEKAKTAIDAIETIQNYALFISSKMRMAYSISHDEPEIMADEANGMMKIAIETTQRSIDAFQKLWESMPDQEEPILDFLAVLDEIRKKATGLFPKALEFDYFEHFAFIR